jgi:hypothetical protein
MIKRLHRRWIIMTALIVGLALDAVAWMLGLYASTYAATSVPMYFVVMKALAPWFAVLLLILGILELRDVKHHHRSGDE